MGRCLLTGAVVVSNQRAAHGFQVGQKLEVVDRRNPMLIRVATVTETDEYRLKVELRPLALRPPVMSQRATMPVM